MKTISKLHYITTSAALAEKACQGGADWIQLRLKGVSYEEYFRVAIDVQDVCRTYGATFIVNDNVQLAKDISAHGVHIGKNDLPPDAARELLGNNFIIGCTANTIDDVVRLSGKQIDYIGLGPYRFTGTKEKLSPILGIAGYKKIFSGLLGRALHAPPIIGIGGITEKDVPELLSTGLYGIAVSSGISNATDVTAACRAFKEIFSYSFQ